MKQVLRMLPLMVFFLGMGCNKTPEGILPLNKMKVVFLHQIMAEELLNNFVVRNEALNFDSAQAVLFSGVMKLDKTDSTTFAKSMEYYKEDIGRFKELLDSVNALAVREKENRVQLEAARARKKAFTDSLKMVDSLARIKKLHPEGKDSIHSLKDSLNFKKKPAPGKKDSLLKTLE
jgi:hypothetical protein